MRGPIDFIIVGFEGNKFNGGILRSLKEALDKGTIALLGISVLSKDDEGKVSVADVKSAAEELKMDIADYLPDNNDLIVNDDVNEVAELLKNKSAAGLLVIEHLWAKPLKEAIDRAGGYLVADGRIHPDAAMELK